MGAVIVPAFIAGAFVASPEQGAYAANAIGSGDIIDESIQSADIKNGQVKAADIATDAAGSAEIAGVTKLIYSQCDGDNTAGMTLIVGGNSLSIDCSVAGVLIL